jgi:hypothetical protein
MTRYPQFNQYEMNHLNENLENNSDIIPIVQSAEEVTNQAIVEYQTQPWFNLPEDPFMSWRYFMPKQLEQPFKVPKLYNKSNFGTRPHESSFRASGITFDGGQIVVPTFNGIMRRFNTTQLNAYSEDLSVNFAIKDIIINTNTTKVVIICTSVIISYDIITRQTEAVHQAEEYLKSFRTLIGTFVLDKSGMLYEINERDGLIFCDEIMQITTRIDAAAMVSNEDNDEKIGVLLAVSNGNRIAILRIGKENGLFCCYAVEDLTVDLDGPLILVAGTDYLFVATNTYQFYTFDEHNQPPIAHLYKYEWRSLTQKMADGLPTVLPGQVIQDMSIEGDKLVISFFENIIMIYGTNPLRRVYLIKLNDMAEIVRFFNGFLVFTTYNKICTFKLPKCSNVCDECLIWFDTIVVKYYNSLRTICLCKHALNY